MKYLETKNKKAKLQPIKFFSGVLTASMLMFGAVSCNQATEENNETAVVEEEYSEDIGFENENELVTNTETEVGGFENWDANNDDMLDEDEFSSVTTEGDVFNEWDADEDGLFSDNELNEGIFDTYDADEDRSLTSEEFDTWNTAWEGEYDNFETWDANDNDILEFDEYESGINDAGVYDEWDADEDGLFSEDEISEGLFDSWDQDNDEVLSSNEYENIGNDRWGF